MTSRRRPLVQVIARSATSITTTGCYERIPCAMFTHCGSAQAVLLPCGQIPDRVASPRLPALLALGRRRPSPRPHHQHTDEGR